MTRFIRHWPLHQFLALSFFWAAVAFAGPQDVSQDRDLKELDLTKWDCLNYAGGTAKTQDGTERNTLKNRSIPNPMPLVSPQFDTAGFLKLVADFDAQTKGKRRKDLTPAEKQKLDALEKQMVCLTGYLVLAYCGPPESTNCGSVDFHDWHLEVFEKPADHPPQPGDPTPIICEITPRTQTKIFRDNVRIQELTAFFRGPDLTHESTKHKARQIRLTGYLLWDDDHNGKADVGPKIESVGANKYHHPWRSTAWEIHPVIKVEPLEGLGSIKAGARPPPAAPVPSPAPSAEATPGGPSPETAPVQTPETATPTPAPSTPPPMQFTVLTQPVKVRIPYGETVLQPGAKLRVVSRNGETVFVQYMDATYPIPVSSTDLPR